MSDSATVILINRAGMGEAEPALQQKLLATYLRLLNENNSLPAAICVYAEGVKLVVTDSPVLAELQALEARGVHVISCLTCLDYYGLVEQLAVGVIGGMPDIIAAQWGAQKVITL